MKQSKLVDNKNLRMDASTISLLILIGMNLTCVVVILISFSIIRRVRGDKAKIRVLQEDSHCFNSSLNPLEEPFLS